MTATADDPDVDAGADAGSVGHRPLRSPRRRLAPWAVFLVAAPLLAWAAIWVATDRYGVNPAYPGGAETEGPAVIEGLSRWDSDWYEFIATEGYFFDTSRQSAVAFFPAYPVAMWGLGAVVGDVEIAGTLITLVATVAAGVLLFRWVAARAGPAAAAATLVLVAAYPYAFFLYGAVYSDALFLAAVLASFAALEHDRPVLAGLVGIVVTAGRPVGMALAMALVVGQLHRRGVLADVMRPRRWGSARWWQRLDTRDAGVLLAPLGLAAYMAYQWVDFGTPFAFIQTQGSEGWAHDPTVDTFLKTVLWDIVTDPDAGYAWFTFTLQAALSLGALVLLVPVWRRFGPTYGTYTAVVVLIAVVPSSNFLGMGRYLLAAFPLFVLVAERVARHRWAVAGVVALTLPAMAVLASFHGRGYLVS